MIPHVFQIMVLLLLAGLAATAEKQKPVVILEGDMVVGRCIGVHDGDSMVSATYVL